MEFEFRFQENLQCVAPICGTDIETISKIQKKETHTRATVLDGPVRARELSKVVTSHLRLDLNGVEDLLVACSVVRPERFYVMIIQTLPL